MIKYMRHIFIFIVVWLAAGTICSFAQYKPDRLGEGFEAKTIVMPAFPERNNRYIRARKAPLYACRTMTNSEQESSLPFRCNRPA